jgi:hypothetical protein
MDIRVIEVARPAGFPVPDELFIGGSATQAGDELSEAIIMKKTSTNTFEAYTSLKSGSYHFSSRNSGVPDTFYIDGDKLRADGKTEYAGDEKVYRISVDFSNGTTEINEISKVELWFAPNDVFLTDLPYTSNGTWLVADFPIEFRQDDGGRDERYKFRFSVVDSEGNAEEEGFGSTNGDNQRPTDSTGPDYWYMVPVSDDRWSNSFKFATEVDNANSDIRVIFNAEVPDYTRAISVN